MTLTKSERISFVWGPWFFGMILITSGILATVLAPALVQGMIMVSAGLVCMALFCACSLLAKIIEK